MKQQSWSWLTLAGAIVALAGLVGGVWMQVDGPFGDSPLSDSAAYRWQLAMAPLMVVALGLAVVGIAQLLRTRVPASPESRQPTWPPA